MVYIGCGMAYRIWYGMYDVVWSIGSGIEYDKVYTVRSLVKVNCNLLIILLNFYQTTMMYGSFLPQSQTILGNT